MCTNPMRSNVLFQLLYQIAVGALLVVEVVQHPYLGAIDRADDLECFADRRLISHFPRGSSPSDDDLQFHLLVREQHA